MYSHYFSSVPLGQTTVSFTCIVFHLMALFESPGQLFFQISHSLDLSDCLILGQLKANMSGKNTL